ncbi:unnamed protein product [Tenebrio molitor]|nr:unnamed protein product [Tenebrio molitor]
MRLDSEFSEILVQLSKSKVMLVVTRRIRRTTKLISFQHFFQELHSSCHFGIITNLHYWPCCGLLD